jgi:hypothetical protein
MVIVIGIFQLAYNNEEAVYLKKNYSDIKMIAHPYIIISSICDFFKCTHHLLSNN